MQQHTISDGGRAIPAARMQKQSKRRMKALVVTALGDPTAPLDDSVLKLTTQHPVPKLPAGHVRIRTVAASLNFADMLQVQGSYQVGMSRVWIAFCNYHA